MNTKDIFFQKGRLKAAMRDLLDTIVEHGEDGVCVSDVEFSLYEFRGVLEDFEESLRS